MESDFGCSDFFLGGSIFWIQIFWTSKNWDSPISQQISPKVNPSGNGKQEGKGPVLEQFGKERSNVEKEENARWVGCLLQRKPHKEKDRHKFGEANDQTYPLKTRIRTQSSKINTTVYVSKDGQD